ncbi:MAG: heme o synthase [Alphaproteobacteria bacterium]|nr:heme o synthase [Alphaproteobacteria bacterium]
MAITKAELGADSSIGDYFTLLKPGVMSLVVFTGATGLWLAPVHIHPFLQVIAILCIALASGAGGAINMYYDHDIDALMKRTASRPVPAGRIAKDDALVMGLVLSITSVGLMGLALNWIAAAWLAFAIFFYTVIYTMLLKRSTPHNIVIGGAAGAFPAVIGWAAATGDAWAVTPWLLFLIVFIWTPSHFWALALYRHDDYAKARVPMLPVTHGLVRTKREIFIYSLLLVASSLTPLWFSDVGVVYGVVATALGVNYLWHAWRVLRSDVPKDAMRLFGFSILYLFILFGALLTDRFIAPLLISA